MAFMNIDMKTSPLFSMMSAFEESILDGFGTVGKILSKRWDIDVSCEPGILDFLKRRQVRVRSGAATPDWQGLSPMALELDIFLAEQ